METIILQIVDEKNHKTYDIETPKELLLKDFLQALKDTYGLTLDLQRTESIFVRTENPVGFLKGNQPLSVYGIRNASRIFVY